MSNLAEHYFKLLRYEPFNEARSTTEIPMALNEKRNPLVARKIAEHFMAHEQNHKHDVENTVLDLLEFPELGIGKMDVPTIVGTLTPVAKAFTANSYWMRTNEAPAMFIFRPSLYRRKHS